MAERTGYKMRGGIAVVLLDNPPVNALDARERARFSAVFSQAAADPESQVILILGRGKCFSAGADITEFDAPPQAPSMAQLCAQVENCSKPVVAVMHGFALGAGLELAMAAHYRFAQKDTQVGLPDVKLGLPPSGGGTQRAPRLIGVKPALDLMLSGAVKRISVKSIAALADATFDRDPMNSALAYAEALRDQGIGPMRTVDLTEGLEPRDQIDAELAARMAMVADRVESAPAAIVDAVESGLVDGIDAGLEAEAAAFEDCLQTDESRALRHAFFAERRAMKAAQLQGSPAPLRRVAVLGAGGLPGQIVVTLLNAGLEVCWGMQDLSYLFEAEKRLRQYYDQTIAEGRLDSAGREARLDRLSLGTSADMVAGADLIIHAAHGQAGVRADPGIPRLMAFPGQVDQVGIRFTQPVPVGRLVEVVEGPRASDAQLDAAFALVARLGRLPVHVVSTGLSISERMAAACYRAADALVDTGLSPYEVDAAVLSWGWIRPPFQLRDMLGIEASIGFARAKGAENWSAVMVDMGRKGRALGAGFYDYPTGEPPRPARAVLEAVNARRDPKRRISKANTARLVIAAMANEGARTLADGWATYPSDIDIACLYALEFPRWRGGPMMAADQIGLEACMTLMDGFDHVDEAFWTPHELMEELFYGARGFGSMNG